MQSDTIINVKLTTLNLQGFVNWETRKPHILAYLQRTQPDIILFQEVVFLPEISSFNQVQLLNQTLDYAFEYSSVTRLQVGEEYPTYREGLAFLSAYPATKTDTIVLKQAPGDEHNRIVQLIDLFVDGRIIKLANVHFSLTDTTDFATAHLQETLQILAARGEERIIAGDFNLSNLESTAELWQDHYRASSEYAYTSFPRDNKRIDYILIPKSHHFNILTTSADDLSDHLAITAEISVRHSPPKMPVPKAHSFIKDSVLQ